MSNHAKTSMESLPYRSKNEHIEKICGGWTFFSPRPKIMALASTLDFTFL